MKRNLQIKLLQSDFPNIFRESPGVVMQKDNFAFSIGSFQLDNLICSMQSGQIQILANRPVLFERFLVYKILSVPECAADHFF